jgi:hypothetical protein
MGTSSRSIRSVAPVWLLGLAAISVVSASPVTRSGAERAGADDEVPVLVELFTSEGCSSCPPADALLIQLAQTQPVKGVSVIALGEHVDYWDRLGWRDPFSDARFSERQSAYAAARRSSNIYTPQMIVDGDAEFVGSDRDTALAAIARAASRPKPRIALTWLPAPNERTATLWVDLPAGATADGAAVYVAIAEDGLRSDVARGENAGRALTHGAVVRRLTKIGVVRGEAPFRTETRLTVDRAWHPGAIRVVAFAQRDDLHVVAAGATRWPL